MNAFEQRMSKREERAALSVPLFDDDEREDELPRIPSRTPRHVKLREPWAYGHERYTAAGPHPSADNFSLCGKTTGCDLQPFQREGNDL